MPEGPFGFPRLTDVGPFVTAEDEKTPEEMFESIRRRSHSYRNYSPQEFREVVKAGVPKPKLRREMRVMESGRFDPLLKQTHKFFRALDKDERELFAQRNPGLIQWMNTWGMLEDLKTWEKYER